MTQGKTSVGAIISPESRNNRRSPVAEDSSVKGSGDEAAAETVPRQGHPEPGRGRIRALSALIPAALVTGGLFSFMNSAIEVNDFKLDETPQRELAILTPNLPESDPFVSETVKPEPLDVAPVPPAAPKLSLGATDISLPQINLEGRAPDVPAGGRISNDLPPMPTIGERVLQPLSPPQPLFPDGAVTRGISGSCDVHMSVDPRGTPFNIEARCTDRVFKRAAESAVARSRFAPQIQRGTPVTVTNVVYPISFEYEN